MTSPLPLSIYDPCCTYCHREVEKPEMFLWGKEVHWVCSKKCKKGMLEGSKKKVNDNPKVLLNKLIKMYVSYYNKKGEQKMNRGINERKAIKMIFTGFLLNYIGVILFGLGIRESKIIIGSLSIVGIFTGMGLLFYGGYSLGWEYKRLSSEVRNG